MARMPYATQRETPSTSVEEASASTQWFCVDAMDEVLGRLASDIAKVLMGKHKVSYTPHVDDGDGVIVVNAEKIRLTGGKEDKKMYHRHTGWMGGIRSINARTLREKKPVELLRQAVSGMLPKNKLRDKMLRRLKLYVGAEHSHKAQKPQPFTFRHSA